MTVDELRAKLRDVDGDRLVVISLDGKAQEVEGADVAWYEQVTTFTGQVHDPADDDQEGDNCYRAFALWGRG